MKSKFLLSIGLLFLFVIAGNTKLTANEKEVKNESISISCTPEVQNLTNSLIQEYRKVNPDITIETAEINVSDIANSFTEESKVVIASEELDKIASGQPLWKMLIGRDITVPVISTENPFCELINQHGISAQKLNKVISGTTNSEWGTLLGNNEKKEVHLYILNDETVQTSVAEFLGVSLETISKFKTVTSEEMEQLLQKDQYALGFCRFLDMSGSDQEQFSGSLKILPLDKNDNGRLDYNEKIYGNMDSFKRGVWIGKYPKSLVHNIYSVTASHPENENVTAFLKWVVVDGQQFMKPSGYNELVYAERKSKLDELNRVEIPVGFTQPENFSLGAAILIIVGIGLVVLIFSFFIRGKIKSGRTSYGILGKPVVLNENSVNVPNGLYFDKTHTWSFMEKDGTVRVGIDDFLQHITGTYTNLKMKDPGEKVTKNEPLITLIQKGKQINIHAPISGKIKELNEELVTEPSLINSSPYDEGWIYLIEPSNWQREIGFLKIAETYKNWLKKEFSRFKDFLAGAVNSQNAGNSQLVFQEGGEIMDRTMEEFGPCVWEDFQKNFIDNSDIN